LHIFQDHLKKLCSPMEKGRMEFSITSLEPGGKSIPNGNIQIFFYINSNCVFSKTIWKKRCSPMEKGRIEFSITSLEPGWKFRTKYPHIFSKIIPLWGKSSEPVSEPAYSLAIYYILGRFLNLKILLFPKETLEKCSLLFFAIFCNFYFLIFYFVLF